MGKLISIHALLAESEYFLLSLDARLSISIHALLAESDALRDTLYCTVTISIHALLAESDSWASMFALTTYNFYPRSPCGERPRAWPASSPRRYFYPRSPCGERTTRVTAPAPIAPYFYPRSPCGERTSRLHKILADWDFYPRSPCGERHHTRPIYRAARTFLSTLSLRRATMILLLPLTLILNFYPRSPCGERPQIRHNTPWQDNFYPRSPCGERHHRSDTIHRGRTISIHALLAESDPPRVATLFGRCYFYPRSPCGERQA